MLLFGLNEYLRDLPYPSAIVVTLTDIDNPQEKLAGYLESWIFPGHASALESRFSRSWTRAEVAERKGLNSSPVSIIKTFKLYNSRIILDRSYRLD